MLKLALLTDLNYQNNKIQPTTYFLEEGGVVICRIHELSDFEELQKIKCIRFFSFTDDFLKEYIHKIWNSNQYKITYVNHKPDRAKTHLAYEKRKIYAVDISNGENTLCLWKDGSISTNNINLLNEIIKICMTIYFEDIYQCLILN